MPEPPGASAFLRFSVQNVATISEIADDSELTLETLLLELNQVVSIHASTLCTVFINLIATCVYI